MNWKILTIPAFFIFLRTAEILYPKNKNSIGNWRIYQNLLFAATWLIIVLFFLEGTVLLWGNHMLSTGYNLRTLLTSYIHLPTIIYVFFSFLILDYSTYLWHRMTHKLAFLWRFHRMHHSDLEMDASSIFRFHFIELSLHYSYKIIIAASLGIPMSHLATYEIIVALCSLFHHSNIYIPEIIDQFLRKFIITRSLHINHHQMDLKLAHSNYSSTLTIWDALHGTLSKPNSNTVEICGLPKYRNKESLTFYRTLFVLPLKNDNKIPAKNPDKPSIR